MDEGWQCRQSRAALRDDPRQESATHAAANCAMEQGGQYHALARLAWRRGSLQHLGLGFELLNQLVNTTNLGEE